MLSLLYDTPLFNPEVFFPLYLFHAIDQFAPSYDNVIGATSMKIQNKIKPHFPKNATRSQAGKNPLAYKTIEQPSDPKRTHSP